MKCFNKRRTAGILAGMIPCGTIINLMEMNKSESNVLVSSFLLKTNVFLNNTIKYFCYDDACHISNLSNELKDKTFVIGIASFN